MKTDDITQGIGTFWKLVPNCLCCEWFVLTTSWKSEVVLRPCLRGILQLLPLKEANQEIIWSKTRACLNDMPAFCCGELLQHHFSAPSWSWRHSRGLHGQQSGQMLRTAPASTHSGHRPTLRETTARSKMHRMSAGWGRRCMSRSEAERICHGGQRVYC